MVVAQAAAVDQASHRHALGPGMDRPAVVRRSLAERAASLGTALFGFACGGLMHLLADWPNPLGVPWILQRHSLNWWKSGRCDLIVVAAAWIGALWVAQAAWQRDALLEHWLHWLRMA